MAPIHSPADDIVYNLVSVQYHALTATQAYDSYIEDADGHDDGVHHGVAEDWILGERIGVVVEANPSLPEFGGGQDPVMEAVPER